MNGEMGGLGRGFLGAREGDSSRFLLGCEVVEMWWW